MQLLTLAYMQRYNLDHLLLFTSKDLQTSSCVHSTSGEHSGCGGVIEIGLVDGLK